LELLAPRRKRGSLLPVLATITGLSAAAGAIWFVNNQQPAPLPQSGAGAAAKGAQASKPAPGAYWQEEGAWGVNVNSIPLASAQAEAAARPASGAGHAAKPAEPAVHAAKPAKPDKPEKPAEEPKKPEPETKPELVTLTETHEPAPRVEKPVPAAERAPLNRASALAALSSAASSASSCGHGSGPSGAGSASITFSPDGPVSSVSLSAPFAGTAVGSCIQSAFRGAHVPAFSGSAVTLSKSFRISD